jgi:hypothetical protein
VGHATVLPLSTPCTSFPCRQGERLSPIAVQWCLCVCCSWCGVCAAVAVPVQSRCLGGGVWGVVCTVLAPPVRGATSDSPMAGSDQC